jgi:hypothetical protein
MNFITATVFASAIAPCTQHAAGITPITKYFAVPNTASSSRHFADDTGQYHYVEESQ